MTNGTERLRRLQDEKRQDYLESMRNPPRGRSYAMMNNSNESMVGELIRNSKARETYYLQLSHLECNKRIRLLCPKNSYDTSHGSKDGVIYKSRERYIVMCLNPIFEKERKTAQDAALFRKNHIGQTKDRYVPGCGEECPIFKEWANQIEYAKKVEADMKTMDKEIEQKKTEENTEARNQAPNNPADIMSSHHNL